MFPYSILAQIPTALVDSLETVEQEKAAAWRSLPLDEAVDKFVSGLIELAINILIAAIVFYVGKFIIKKIYNFVLKLLLKRSVDISLTTFLLSTVKMVLYFILIVTVIGILGIETTSFLALFASAGVAIGMALSGTLQNFAGGVLILLLKPYRVGDYIEAQGFAGTVKEIQIFHTIITTADNKAIIIPNGGLSTGSVNNYSREEYRRVDWSIGISYGNDVDVARKTILAMLLNDDRVVKQYIEDDKAARHIDEQQQSTEEQPADDKPKGFWARLFSRHKERVESWRQAHAKSTPQIILPKADCAPVVFLENLADSAVQLKVRAWTRSEFYWGLFFDMNERFYNELPKAGIEFPFPQLDVHLTRNQ